MLPEQDNLPTNNLTLTDQVPLAVSAERILIFDHPDRVFVTDPEGLDPIELNFDGGINAPALSPDAKSVAYFKDQYLYIMDVESKESKVISQKPISGFLSKMGWSPDSQKLAFDCTPGTSSISELCIMDITSGQLEVLTNAVQLGAGQFDGVSFGSWSRDGDFIAFTVSSVSLNGGGARGTLYSINLVTQQVRKILEETDVLIHIEGGDFSADGNSVFFTAKAEENYGIFRVEVGGSNLSRVTSPEAKFQIRDPVVSPDGALFFAYAIDITNDRGTGVPTLFTSEGKMIRQLSSMPGIVQSWVSP